MAASLPPGPDGGSLYTWIGLRGWILGLASERLALDRRAFLLASALLLLDRRSFLPLLDIDPWRWLLIPTYQ